MRQTSTRSSRSSSEQSRAGDERGFVLVWFALLIVVMLGVAAFAVDLGHAYYVAQQAQDSADAAALSAAPYLPDNCTNANPHAVDISAANGFPNAGNTTVSAVNGAPGGAGCDADPSLLPNQIKVDITTKVDTWFARALGIDTLSVTRSSTAEYDPPVQLGSPHSYFGNVPGCAACEQPSIWASVAGQANRKVDGNAIFENWCTNTTTADNCTAGDPNNNSDHDDNGMLFEISNPTRQNLNVELFDPGYVAGSLTCGGGDPTVCPGDEVLSQQSAAAPPTSTTFTLYPLDNLTNPLGNPATCSATYPGYTSAPAPNPVDLTARSFHSWANFGSDAGCGALNATSYVLQVRTGDDLGLPPEAGVNNFSVAACTGCGANQPSDDSNVDVSAITKMSLFANAPPGTSNPQFYLARVPSWAKGQFLTLSFFDVGDISAAGGSTSIAGALTVTAKDATHGAGGSSIGEFSNCTYSHPDSRGNTAGDYIGGQTTPWDPDPVDTAFASNPNSLTSMGGGCTAQVLPNSSTGASFWNGKWVTWKVPIPSDYTCNDKDLTKCWLQIQYNYTNAQFHDATTWTATLSGNPVRLTK